MPNFLSSPGGVFDRVERGVATLARLPFHAPRLMTREAAQAADHLQCLGSAARNAASLPAQAVGRIAGQLGLMTSTGPTPPRTGLSGLLNAAGEVAALAELGPEAVAGSMLYNLIRRGQKAAPPAGNQAVLPTTPSAGVTIAPRSLSALAGEVGQALGSATTALTGGMAHPAPAYAEWFKKAAGQTLGQGAELVSGPGGRLRDASSRGLSLAHDLSHDMTNLASRLTAPPVSRALAQAPAQTPARPGRGTSAAENALLQRIAMGEGTSDDAARKRSFASGYDVPLAYGAYGRPDKPLSQMTLDELDDFQTSMLRDPRNKMNSSASGKYQITRTTMRALRKQMGLTGDQVFTPELQDELAMRLLKGRGYDHFRAGKITEDQFQDALSKEWASVARPSTGRSYYGQATGTRSTDIRPLINGLR